MESLADGNDIYNGAGDAQAEANARLELLLAANAEIERQKQLYRREEDKSAALAMAQPLSSPQAFGLFGALLGTLPPLSIFYRISNFRDGVWIVLSFLMASMCAFVGYKLAKSLGNTFLNLERESWAKMLLVTSLLGTVWALATGAAGGAIFFGVGAIFGVIFALPVAFVAFPLFAILHRLLERGGNIERKHALPIAFGITLTISAYILGL